MRRAERLVCSVLFQREIRTHLQSLLTLPDYLPAIFFSFRISIGLTLASFWRLFFVLSAVISWQFFVSSGNSTAMLLSLAFIYPGQLSPKAEAISFSLSAMSDLATLVLIFSVERLPCRRPKSSEGTTVFCPFDFVSLLSSLVR